MPCVAAQRDANKAIEDRERYSKEAQAYTNDILPKAEGAAQRQLQDAEALQGAGRGAGRRRRGALQQHLQPPTRRRPM